MNQEVFLLVLWTWLMFICLVSTAVLIGGMGLALAIGSKETEAR